MHKKILSLFLLVIASLSLVAQDQAKWSYSFEPANAKVGDKGFLVLKANIKEGWHIYGTEDGCNGMGPLLTVLKLKTKEGFETSGKLQAIGAKNHFSEDFDCEISELEGIAVYKQAIKFTGESLKASGLVDYMVCQTGMCIPFDDVFEVSGKAQPAATDAGKVDLGASGEKTDGKEKTQVSTPHENKPDETVTEESIEISVSGIEPVDTVNEVSIELVTPTASILADGEDCDIERKAGWDDITINRFDAEKTDQDLGDILLFILAAFFAGLITVI